MSYHTDTRKKLLFETFDKFPELSNRGTAAYLFKYYPEFFKDIEDARGIVRIYRGAKGEKIRNQVKFNKYYR